MSLPFTASCRREKQRPPRAPPRALGDAAQPRDVLGCVPCPTASPFFRASRSRKRACRSGTGGGAPAWGVAQRAVVLLDQQQDAAGLLRRKVQAAQKHSAMCGSPWGGRKNGRRHARPRSCTRACRSRAAAWPSAARAAGACPAARTLCSHTSYLWCGFCWRSQTWAQLGQRMPIIPERQQRPLREAAAQQAGQLGAQRSAATQSSRASCRRMAAAVSDSTANPSWDANRTARRMRSASS